MAQKSGLSRRDFLARSAAATATLSIPTGVFAHSQSTLKVGLIGCGGRGTGAAFDSLAAHPGTVIWSIGDIFQDRVDGARRTFNENVEDKKRYQVTKEREFVGWDAYKGVLETKPDYVILATPPGFRPLHFEAAINAGCHVFTEKPVATDAPGVRRFMMASNLATQKKLNVVCGTQRRHQVPYLEVMKRIHDGQIGDVVALYSYWNQGGLWSVERTPQMSDVEWQLRNWLYFTWSSGDHIVEQHIHNIDVCNWAMQAHPVKAISLAGRQVRTNPQFGHIFDHFMTQYEYANGVIQTSSCRQIDNTAGRVSELVVGTKGKSDPGSWIRGENPYNFSGESPNPYMLEHRDLIKAIQQGPYLNEGMRVAESTLTAIMGRMAGYTGKEVTWDQALNSKEVLVPDDLKFGPHDVPAVAMPGKTQLM